MDNLQTSHDAAGARLLRLEGFLAQDPGNPHLLNDAFQAALAAARFDAAEFHLTHARALGHDARLWQLHAIHLDLARHRWDDARAAITSLMAEPGLDKALSDSLSQDLAYVLFEQRDHAAALASLEPVVASATADGSELPVSSQQLLLRLWHRSAKLDEAMNWARAADAAGRLAPVAAGVASLVAVDAGDLPLAGQWMRRAEQGGTNTVESLLTASTLALASRDGDAAQGFARQALAMNGEDGRSWSMLGLAQLLGGGLPESQQSLERAVLTMPEHVGTWLALGWVRVMRQDAAAAQAAFEEGLARDRNFAECHGALAVALAMQGQDEPARQSIERAQRLDPAGLSAQFAQLVLDGHGQVDPAALRDVAGKLLGQRLGPMGGTMSDWLR